MHNRKIYFLIRHLENMQRLCHMNTGNSKDFRMSMRT